MKYTILLTLKCNLRCSYCYIDKKENSINIITAEKIIDFIFSNTPAKESIYLGFFGGEPLLEFESLKAIVLLLENHPLYAEREIEIQVVSNGTIFTDEIADFLIQHNIVLGLSCDGIPSIQDKHRRFQDNTPSSAIVEKTILQAIQTFPSLMVNAVYTPATYKYLPETVEYFYSLGIRKIYINPDFGADWSAMDVNQVNEIYDQLADIYLKWDDLGDTAFISPINSKLAVILNNGYKPGDKCQMGIKEFAISPDGNLFPCERLLGNGDKNAHCIGDIYHGLDIRKLTCGKFCHPVEQSECIDCTLKNYCMNWCGCSNFFSTGYYNYVGAFICGSEKAAIKSAFKVFQVLNNKYGSLLIRKILGDGCRKISVTI
ncbi:MAG: radical SAM protein [Bacteroidetes bacterium]|nr:radical SAM protein [Bacteroidota bacterium]